MGNDWIQTLSVIGTTLAAVIGSAYYIHRDIIEDVKMQNSRLDQVNSRIDQANSRMDQANTRTDQLYQMFIDLLRDGKK